MELRKRVLNRGGSLKGQSAKEVSEGWKLDSGKGKSLPPRRIS